MKKLVLTFRSTHDAIAAQNRLAEAAIPYTIIPTPVEITSDCGIAVLVDENRREHACRALASLAVRYTGARLDGGKLSLTLTET